MKEGYQRITHLGSGEVMEFPIDFDKAVRLVKGTIHIFKDICNLSTRKKVFEEFILDGIPVQVAMDILNTACNELDME